MLLANEIKTHSDKLEEDFVYMVIGRKSTEGKDSVLHYVTGYTPRSVKFFAKKHLDKSYSIVEVVGYARGFGIKKWGNSRNCHFIRIKGMNRDRWITLVEKGKRTADFDQYHLY